MQKTLIRLPFLLLAAFLLPVEAARGAGGSSAAFLQMGWGARPAAMGDAFTAAADDVDAVYWNPAGLIDVKRLQQTFGHNSWISGLNAEHAAFALRRSTAVIGAGVGFLNYGDIERANKYGYTEGYYSANDMALVFSYARPWKSRLAVGGNFKIVRERIEDMSATAFALDAGAIYQKSPRLKLGATLKNLGTGLALGKTSYPLPMALRAGAAFQFRKDLLLTSDISLPFDDSASFCFGAEYLYPSPIKGVRLTLRAGLKTAAISYLGALSAVALGFGAQAGAIALDYALSPYGDLGAAHRLSLKIKFESPAAEPAPGVITVEKSGVKASRGAAEIYRAAMDWFSGKAVSEKLSSGEQSLILQRIIDKFVPLGVDVTEARQKLAGRADAPK